MSRAIGSDALTSMERAILTLGDTGVAAADVAAQLGVAPSYAQHVIHNFPISDRGERRARARAEIDNARYVAALFATGRRFA